MDRSEDKTVINFPVRDAEHGNWLAKGYVLEGRYVIEAQVGAGGFGITYLAKHRYLEDIWVAIKEYLPDGAAVRDSGSRVHVVSERYTKMYSWGLHRFLDEARLLRQFKHPNIVSVQDFFEANNTAYLVMNYVRGRSLQAELDGGRFFTEEQLRSIIYPLLDALQCIHHEGLYHRDISPDNILLQEQDDSPVLIDFGSARYAMRMHGAEQVKDGQAYTPTAIFKQGYSPIEQYEGTTQGPYTDIYALGATLYRAALGTTPTDALKRSGELRLKKIDPLEPASEKGREKFSKAFLKAIDVALKLEVNDRPQTIDAWLDIFGKPPQTETQLVPPTSRKPLWRNSKVIFSVVTITLALGLIAHFSFRQLRNTVEDIPTLLSEASRELEQAPFSSRGLDESRNLYLQVLTLEQENTRALAGYSATSTLKQFSQAIEENHLGKAATFLDKAERELNRAGIDKNVLFPGRQRLQLRHTEATLRRMIIRQPLLAETWSDIALLLDDMVKLQESEASVTAARRGSEALKATVTAMQKQDFDAAWSQIAKAEQQLSPLGISKLETARSQIKSAHGEWQATRNAEIEALLTTAEQHLKAQPLTTQSLQQARQAYQTALDLDPEQPRARAGLSISHSLLKVLNLSEKDEFAAADEALSDAKHTAGNTRLWNSALQEAQQQLTSARHAWSVSETRSSTRSLLAQVAEGLLDAPFDAKTLNQVDRILQEAQELSREMSELQAENEAASAGSKLIVLLRNTRVLFNNADFEDARKQMQSQEIRTLSNRLGLGRPFVNMAIGSIDNAEIAWSLSQVKTLLSENLLDSSTLEKARQHLQRVLTLDTKHAEGKAVLVALESLHAAAEARQGHDYDIASTALHKAQPPLVTLGISADLFEAIAATIRQEQQAWLVQQRENTITGKLSDAVTLLQQHPFDSTAWQKSEALFNEISSIKDGSERANSSKSMLASLKSAKQMSGARRFNDAQAQITQAEKILAKIGAGRFEEARKQVSADNLAWENQKQKMIATALASATQILGDQGPSPAVLSQARDAYQSALELDSGQKQAHAGLTIIASLETFLQALQADDFDVAEQHLNEATATAKLAQLDPALLKSATNRLSADRATWQANQAKLEILTIQRRVSELLDQAGPLEQRLQRAEKALQEAVILSLTHQGLEAYTVQSNAGLEAIILLRVFTDELKRKKFNTAKQTLSDISQLLSKAKLESTILDELSQTVVSAEIDWLLADAVRILSDSNESTISNVSLDKATTNFSAAMALDPQRTEIESALQGISSLRQVKMEHSRRDYDSAMAMLEQATKDLTSVGLAEATFDAFKHRLSQEQRRWQSLTLERNVNAWTGEAIDALNRSPYDETTWQTVDSLAEKITTASATDPRGIAVKNALSNMQQVKQAIDDRRFRDAPVYITQAQSELAAIGLRNPLKNAHRQLELAIRQARQTQLTLTTDALREDPVSEPALVNAKAALEPILSFLPDDPIAKAGLAAIDLIQASDAAIANTEFAKSARLLREANRQLKSIKTSDSPVPEFSKAWLDARRRLANQRPSPSEIYPLISVALETIAKDPLNPEMLATADKLLHNVLAMQSDEPTASAALQATDQLRITNRSLAQGAYTEAKTALGQVEGFFGDIGLSKAVLAPAWQALEAAEK